MTALPTVTSKYELAPRTNDELRAMLPKGSQGGRTIMIDPVSPEFNRGSFCYMGYLLFSAMQDLGCDITILENFCAADVDTIPQVGVDQYLIVLWNHTQIEHVQTLIRFLPRGKCLVFGFYGMIEAQHLPVYQVPASIIQRGMVTYHRNYRFFKQILLSDCDMHLKEFSGQVYPFFTTYGCPRGCNFCPTTLNFPPNSPEGGRIATPLNELFSVLREMLDKDMVGFHFTDEDFYLDMDRTYAVVDWLSKQPEAIEKRMQIITLGERHTVAAFAKRYGWQVLVDAGIKLIEIGLESAEEDLGKDMGKGGIKVCRKIAEECPIHVLWLTMAFYPGETIQSLNKTGAFMKENGLTADELYERVATNGTHGGLGQFCQYYEGFMLDKNGKRISVDNVELEGTVFSRRPLRLMPSFIPYSFQNDVIKGIGRPFEASDDQWFDNYRVDKPVLGQGFMVGKTVKQVVEEQYANPLDGYIAMAVAAKIGVLV